MPHFHYDSDSGLMYTDIAGLNDSSGDLVDLINRLIIKGIFKKSKSVKFMVTITHVSMKEGRGQGVRENFQAIEAICYGINLSDMLTSVKPVITKANPLDSEIDIDVLRNDLYEQLTQNVNTQKNNDDIIRHGTPEEQEARKEYFDKLEEFYSDLSDKFDLVDPIDRVFPPPEGVDGSNQAIEVKQLKKEIDNLSSIEGKKLNAPLTPAIMCKLQDLFTAEDKKCHQILEEYVDEAKKNRDFDKDIGKHE